MQTKIYSPKNSFANSICVMLVMIVAALQPIYGYSTNYYVSDGQGSDANAGTAAAPFKTLQKAANLTNPGDTVFIMNGTYVKMSGAQLLTINNSGSPELPIVYTSFPGHKPVLKKNNIVRYAIVIQPGTSYIVIDGLTIKGNNGELTLQEAVAAAANGDKGNKFNGTGISMAPVQDPVTKIIKGSHHITIKKCTVTDFPGAGINVRADYALVENNLIARNAWYGSSGSSGITVYRPYSIDNNVSEYKIIIRNNISHSNHQYVDWIADDGVNHGLTDGNGIIVDQLKLGPKNFIPAAPYKGKVLILNNISYNNGGTGIHAYYSNSVDIINNTAYFNNQGHRNSGQIHASNASNVRLLNNIMWATPGKAATTFRNNTASVIYDYNIYYDGDLSTSYSTDSSGTIRNNIIADPKFVNAPTDFSLAAPSDFKLRSGSPAINSGIGTGMPDTDFEGNPRPYGSGIDRGAFEFTDEPRVGLVIPGGSLTYTQCDSVTLIASIINLNPDAQVSFYANGELLGSDDNGSDGYGFSGKLPVGNITLTAIATDSAGNNATSAALVINIQADSQAPTVLTRNATITLVNGQASIAAAAIDSGSTDACGIASLSLDKTSFDCSSIGSQTVTLTVTDLNGNAASATATVTVVGEVQSAPSIAVTRTDNTPTGTGMEQTIVLGYGAQSLTLAASVSGSANGTTYSWSPASGLSSLSGAGTVFTPMAAGSYPFAVTATNAYGCQAAHTVTITVIEARCGNKNNKVKVCHNGKELCISPNAVQAHLSHGDKIGGCESSSPATIFITLEAGEKGKLGGELSLQAFPNPVLTQTTIRYGLTEASMVLLEIYDMAGKKVSTLVNGKKQAGIQQISYDSSLLAEGIYLVKLAAGNKYHTLKLIVAK